MYQTKTFRVMQNFNEKVMIYKYRTGIQKVNLSLKYMQNTLQRYIYKIIGINL